VSLEPTPIATKPTHATAKPKTKNVKPIKNGVMDPFAN